MKNSVALAIFVIQLAGMMPLDAQAPVSIYVGPHMRDGFVDVDQGILDSIADIKNELQKMRRYTLAATPEQATIALVVLSRHSPGDSGGVGIPIGAGMTVIAPIKRLAIESILKFGTYERRLLSEDEGGGTWRAAAKRTAQDLTAWVTANHHMLPK